MNGAVLITGGNSGIGLECARNLARAGRHVLIASRNRAASQAAARSIGGRVEALELDLGSLADVRRFARELVTRGVPVQALVCNAGLQFMAGPKLTPDGYESTFAVNHLGHFLLVNLLLESLAAQAPARIINVASGVHDPAMKTGLPHAAIRDFEVLAKTGGPKEGSFNGLLAYVNSKLCNVWFTYELERRLARAGYADRVTVNAWEPGLVPGSGLARDYPLPLRLIWDWIGPGLAFGASLLTPKIHTASQSGADLARMVQDASLEKVTGRYFPSHSRWQDARSSEESYDTARAAGLWDASVRLASLQPSESPLARL
jgi:NAD(P)-dependent dehydrogenase (short-subunit alcohol dehydrogenase family)